MIDIEKELTAIVERLAIPWEERDGELMEALTALCTRYGDAKLEEAAKVCDEAAKVMTENKTIHATQSVIVEQCEAARVVVSDCATAIRATKKEKG